MITENWLHVQGSNRLLGQRRRVHRSCRRMQVDSKETTSFCVTSNLLCVFIRVLRFLKRWFRRLLKTMKSDGAVGTVGLCDANRRRRSATIPHLIPKIPKLKSKSEFNTRRAKNVTNDISTNHNQHEILHKWNQN